MCVCGGGGYEINKLWVVNHIMVLQPIDRFQFGGVNEYHTANEAVRKKKYLFFIRL